MQTFVATVTGFLAGEYLISRPLFALLGEANGNLYDRHNWFFLWFGRKAGMLIVLWIVR
ncbi:hypothetical protein [Rhodoflexus caldus]|uniref:hypothetical protein n=1 Tax=Rhodoflexus caldus TaxID=2891236 RepID=UPI00202A2FCA|nr:hypothetical protein [Rhodoflexus caldus]